MTNNSQNLGRILKQRRLMIPLTLRQITATSSISSSHLGRIERGEREAGTGDEYCFKHVSSVLQAIVFKSFMMTFK